MSELDLTFPSFPLGTHQVPWNMKILLFKNAASVARKSAILSIDKGEFGKPIEERIPLVIAFHEAISSMISLGKSWVYIESNLEVLWRLFSWLDANSEHISRETIIDIFKRWTEFQINRYQIKKEIGAIHAYRQVSRMANLIAKALQLPGAKPGKNLVLQTRMRKPPQKKRVLGAEADKQNLNHTFEYGHVLTKICGALDVTTVRGKLPILIDVGSDMVLTLAGNLVDPDMETNSIKDMTIRRNAQIARAPLTDDESLFDRHKRSGILNHRVEAELLIFIAQTGMNLTQAASLEKESYRWKSNGEDLEVFRVYKGRRSGEAIFRCFKSYREHLKKYMVWLDETGFSDHDNRLFPLLSRGMIRAKGAKVKFYTSKATFKKINLAFIGPKQLRKTRVNWLLRRSRDLNLTAEQMAHDKGVLLRDYEMPHHQSAAAEIVQFYNATDPLFAPPGPGICIDEGHKPESIAELPKEAPKPDCVSPEGCLFCTKHRDIMSSEYCWKLASHSHIKSLETALYKPSKKQEVHPGYRVIDRITQKLEAIASGSQIRAMWVKEAKDSIRSGKYHPYWDGHIKLLEMIV
ncbi:site-specific integrase [Shewanella vesiculosa]|uniref:site-specific integrase n=1 Tax=Shewanella vesiculosa TaxID=518738 RepID=UPI000F4D8827|nr:site-specific integrase [Shewanella vesiculosa]RPA55983.1 site-specific integrase [Shewanella vesiculosa]UJL42515.1 site-specific integrase [Shewanella vesiculosa]